MFRNLIAPALVSFVGAACLCASGTALSNDLFVTNLNGNIHRVFEDGSKELFADVDGWAHGVVFDSENLLYVASQQEDTVWRYRLDGTPLGAFVTGVDSPIGLTFDEQGRLYVTERGSGNVKRYDSAGDYLGVFANTGNAFDIATDRDGNINVLNRHGTIHRFDVDGTSLGVFELPEGIGAEGLAFDSQNRLYVASQGSDIVLRYVSEGNWETIADSLVAPVGLVFDADDDLFVVESIGSGRVEQFTADGTFQGTYSSGHGFGLYAAFAPVPEPSMGVLATLGLFALAFRRRAGR